MKWGRLFNCPFLLGGLMDMMEAWVIIFRMMTAISSILLVMGFIRPIYVLWFLDRNNRLLVLKVYGSLTVFFWVLYTLGKNIIF